MLQKFGKRVMNKFGLKICIWILNWRILLQSSSRSRQTQPVRLRRDARLVMLRSQMRML